MATSSYITVKNALEQFAENHLVIKRFKTSFFEQIDNFSSSDNTFPILYVVPSDVTFEQYTDRFFFRIYCVDILQKDRSNESAILNDTLLTLRDLYNWLKIADNGLNVLSTARAIPVNNFLVDYTAGWYLDVEVEGLAESNDCSIPFTDNFTLTGYTCDYTYASRFLTCETLEECAVIIDLQNQIDAIVISADTFTVGGSYDNSTGTLNLVRNDGGLIPITGFTTGSTSGTDIYVTGGTFNQGTETLTLGRNDNQTVVITGFTSGVGFDVFVTGGTYSNGSILFTNNTGGTFTVSGLVTGDTFVTGFAYDDANTLTIRQNNDQPDLTVTINNVTGLTTDYFDFNTGATVTPAVSRLRWNDTDGTLDLGLKGGNVTLQIGQEQVVRVVNKTGSNLLESNYQAVRINGAQGNRVKVDLAQANNDANSAETIGLVTENIDNNQEGFITTMGLVRGINTTGSLQGETWIDGDMLYLSPTTAGRITNIKPVAPQHTVIIGYVVQSNPSNGSIFVKVDNGYELGELHNVNVTGATNGQVLTYNSSTQLWIPTTISGGATFTGGTVTGPTIFTNGLSANTFSATTYLNLPTDIRVTGGTFNGSQIEFTNNTGGTFSVTGFTNTTGGIATWSQGADGTLVSGTTTNSVTYTQLISGGTMGNGSLIRVNYRARTTINAANTIRIYVNTTPDLSGSPVLVGQWNNAGAPSFLVNAMSRTLVVKNASNITEVYTTAGLTPGDNGLYNSISNLNINWANDQYFVFALQNPASTLQAARGSYYLIEKI